MSRLGPALLSAVPEPVWAEGRAAGWALLGAEAAADADMLVLLERPATGERVSVELSPRDADRAAWRRFERVQVAHRGSIEVGSAEATRWVMALMVFLARAADRALSAPGPQLPVVVEARSEHGCWHVDHAINVTVFGDVQPCCMSARAYRDGAGRPARLPDVTLGEVWAGADRAALHAALEAGERPVECERCWRPESVGDVSKRTTPVASHSLSLPGVRPDGPRLLTLFASRTCNLRCRTCHPGSSSAIAAEQRRLLQADPGAAAVLGVSAAELAGLGADTWLRPREGSWDWLTSALGSVERLEFLGGEPLLLEQHFDLLEAVVAAGHAGRITLGYATNATRVPARARALWPRFRAVKLVVSLDAVGRRFEYLRHPAEWGVVSENLLALRGISPSVGVTVNATTSAYAALYLPELVAQAEAWGVPLELNPLGEPRFMDPRVLPAAARRAVREALARMPAAPALRQQVDALLTWIDGEDWTADLPRFLAHTRLLDAVRGESFEATFPELAALLRA